MLGPDQPVILHLLDIAPAEEALNGVKMELIDAAFPLLQGTVLYCVALFREEGSVAGVGHDKMNLP